MRLNYKRAQRRQNLGEDMNIDEVKKVPLGTLYFFLQAVHSLVLHIQHVFALNNRIERRKDVYRWRWGNRPSAIMSCVLCGGLNALLSMSWTWHFVLFSTKYDNFIVVLFCQIFLHLIWDRSPPQKPCIWLGFPRGKCRRRSWAGCSTASCSRRQDPGDQLD